MTRDTTGVSCKGVCKMRDMVRTRKMARTLVGESKCEGRDSRADRKEKKRSCHLFLGIKEATWIKAKQQGGSSSSSSERV